MLQWVQQHEPDIRSYAGKELKAGKAHSNLLKHVKSVPKLKDARLVKLFVPSMVVLWAAAAELRFACDDYPMAICSALIVSRCVSKRRNRNPSSSEKSASRTWPNQSWRARCQPRLAILRIVLRINSLLVRAVWGWFEFDPELRQMLTDAIE